MVETDQIIMAVLTGLGFGFLVVLVGSTWQRLGLILFLLWLMQSLSQHLLRAFDGRDVANEVIVVTGLRLIFGISAVGMVVAVEWYDKRKGRLGT